MRRLAVGFFKRPWPWISSPVSWIPPPTSRTAADLGSQRGIFLFNRAFCEQREVASKAKMTVEEAKRLLRQVNVQALKRQLQATESPCIDYGEMSRMCKEAGLAESSEEVRRLVAAMDEAGDIILFRNKVYLYPGEIAEVIAQALPLNLIAEDDPKVKEFEDMQERLLEIEHKAQKQVRKCMWFGLLALTGGTGLLIRLTFWELSWDVMEPVAFFLTSTFLIAGYAYFLVTRRDPTYQGLMHSLLASRRRRLMKWTRFDYDRYKMLERQCVASCRHVRHWRLADQHDD